MKSKKKNKPIAPILKSLKKGEKTEYPIHRYSSVSATCQMLATKGMRFSVCKVGNNVEVTKVN